MLPAGRPQCYSGSRKARKVKVLSAHIAADPSPSRPLRLPQRWGVFAIAGLVAAVNLIPLGFIVWVVVSSGWDQVVTLVFRPRVAELLVNTFLLLAITKDPARGPRLERSAMAALAHATS